MCLFSCACSSSSTTVSNRSRWGRWGVSCGLFLVVLLWGSGGGAGGLAGPLLRRARPRTIIVHILISFLRSCFFALVVCLCSLALPHHPPLLFRTVEAGGGRGFRVGFFGWCSCGGLGEALGALLGPSSGEHVRGPLSLTF